MEENNLQATSPVPDVDQQRIARGSSSGRRRLWKTSRFGRGLARYLFLVFLSVLAGFGGGWLYVGSGLFGADTITERRERVIAEGEVVADVAQKVAPSVVSIVTSSATQPGFFGNTTQTGAGTGIIISKEGYILTNKHVIPTTTQSVSVVLTDGTTYEDVTVVGRDPLNDLAFLKIQGVDSLTPAVLGDSSSMQVGQKVVAIGNALGQFQTTVTSGILSGVGRPVTAGDGGSAGVEQLDNLFQTDAAINPGNSGGPLVNVLGDVIGINTAIAQGAEGIGFAIPINDAKGLIKSVLESGELKRAYLGVRYITLDVEVANRLDIDQKQGAYISGGASSPIVPGSPAEKAGLKNGDIVVSVDGVELTARLTLANVLSQYTPGQKVTLSVLRDGKLRDISVTLDQYNS